MDGPALVTLDYTARTIFVAYFRTRQHGDPSTYDMHSNTYPFPSNFHLLYLCGLFDYFSPHPFLLFTTKEETHYDTSMDDELSSQPQPPSQPLFSTAIPTLSMYKWQIMHLMLDEAPGGTVPVTHAVAEEWRALPHSTAEVAHTLMIVPHDLMYSSCVDPGQLSVVVGTSTGRVAEYRNGELCVDTQLPHGNVPAAMYDRAHYALILHALPYV